LSPSYSDSFIEASLFCSESSFFERSSLETPNKLAKSGVAYLYIMSI